MQSMKKHSRGFQRVWQRGFTLIELMVVLAIIGVLGVFVVPAVMNKPDEARVDKARAELPQIMQALKMYKLDNGRYPAQDQGLTELRTKPNSGTVPPNWRGPYLERDPQDPWGNPYQYLIPGSHGGDVEVISLGRDGVAGGDGLDKDIGSWEI